MRGRRDALSLELSMKSWGGLDSRAQDLSMAWVAVPLRAIALVADFGYGMGALDIALALARARALSLGFGLCFGRVGGQGDALPLEQVPHTV